MRPLGARGLPLHPAPGVVSRQLGDGAVLIDLDTARMFSLNATGAAIWESLRGGRSLDELVAALGQVVVSEATELPRDVEALIEALSAHGLLAGPEDFETRHDMSPVPYPQAPRALTAWTPPVLHSIGTIAEALPQGRIRMPGQHR